MLWQLLKINTLSRCLAYYYLISITDVNVLS